MLDTELDTLVDDVAKGMTAAPPDAQLAHRVAMRIAGLNAPRERAHWMRAWILVPAAGVCALLVAVFVARDNVRQEQKVRLKPDTTGIRANAAVPATGDAVTETGDPERVVLRTTGGVQPRVRGPERAALLPGTLAPLQLDAIEVAPMALSQIDINPIAIDRIEISAMP